jgi:hypothetical protein
MKYHVVRTNNALAAARLVKMAPPHLREKRNGHPCGSGFRTFQEQGVVCTNFEGSSQLFAPGVYEIEWRTLEDGIEVGNVKGLNI